ncbi:putative quinol monooxygenase [Actinoplanes sp. NPDC051513]|uniref:putative quinol monooxygenase n=1 Tax=Actinoplanes sp. NPDC051513 TaxID=3363908 RepID=UPI0037897993
MIIVHGGITVDPSRIGDVEDAGAAFQKASKAEDGCVEYQLSWKIGEPGNLRLLEIWENKDKHQAHKDQAHTREWTAFIGSVAAAPPQFHDITA